MKFAPLLASIGVVLLAGCIIPADATSPFNESDFQYFKVAGSSSIVGHAFLTTYNDVVAVGSDDEVDLTPITPYTKERYAMSNSGRSLTDPDPRLARYVRTTTADDQGNFAFKYIPPGQYILSCTITWQVPSEYLLHAMVTKSETVQMMTTVADGEREKVVLTGSD